MADEEDEDVLDSWEDAADSGDLERRMEERERSLKEGEEEMMCSEQGSITILKSENTGRTEYTPQIKILKRSGLNNVKTNKPKNKTEAELKKALKMREAEYQAARNRILGENYDETKARLEQDDVKISIIKNTTRASPNSPSSPVKVLTPLEKIPPKASDNVIRQPSGPDETQGFKLSR